MACKIKKQITLTVFMQEQTTRDWSFDFDGDSFQLFCNALIKDMKRLGVTVTLVRNREAVIQINSYADLLNVVKISSPENAHSSQCIGHIIGKSENLDILEDIRAAVRRVAFAPETIAPAGEFRKVCHNCGCGC
ncbi:MAG: hypothetical protein WCP20_08770 [Desulfuromonadales bacterium]